jgi:predicted Zn-dependent protease
MRSMWCLVLAFSFLVQSCTKDHVVQTPPRITVLTDCGGPPAQRNDRTDAGRVSTDAKWLEPVLRVSYRLIAAASRSEYAARARATCWTIAVYDDPASIQAFVGADGGITVPTGAFRVAETEAGLAALLSHEFMHALASDEAAPSTTCTSNEGHEPPLHSYEEELRADGAGLTLMAGAGYDPRESLRLWERMKTKEKDSDAVLKHFTYDRRMEELGQRLPEALRRYEWANRAPQKTLPSR